MTLFRAGDQPGIGLRRRRALGGRAGMKRAGAFIKAPASGRVKNWGPGLRE